MKLSNLHKKYSYAREKCYILHFASFEGVLQNISSEGFPEVFYKIRCS